MKRVKFLLGLLNLAALGVLFAAAWPQATPGLAYLAKIQFVPAVLALDAVALVLLLVLTLLFGRVYCEVLCPLGVWQDVCRLLRWNRTRRVCQRLPEPKAQRVVRLAVFLLFAAVLVLAAFNACPALRDVKALLDPYAIFGRAAAWCAALALPDPDRDAALVAQLRGQAVLMAGPFLLVTVLAFVGRGRLWCNAVCPVGTLLHALARFAWKKPRVKACDGCDKCRACWKKADAAEAPQKEAK